MSLYNTSRVFEAARKMKARLVAQSWPVHPATGQAPQVTFVDPDPDAHSEIVWIVPDVGDDQTMPWGRMPNGRDEEFDLLVQIVCVDDYDDDFDEDRVLDRLEELADVVQRAFYDDQFTVPNEAMRPLDISGAQKLQGVGQVSFAITPADRGQYRGVALIRYRVAFRI